MTNETEDKVVYHAAMTACTSRLDDLEKLARSGSVSTPTPRSVYDSFQQTQPSSQGKRSTVSDLNDHLDAIEGTIMLLKGSDDGEQVVRFGGLGFSTLAEYGVVRSKPRRHQVWLNPNRVVEESRNEKNSIEAKRGHDGSGFLLDNEALEDVDYVGTKDSRLPAEADEALHQKEGNIDRRRKLAPPPGFLRMKHLKQKKEAQLLRRKCDPPPGFHRMRELKRQKQSMAQQQQQQQRVAPPPGFEHMGQLEAECSLVCELGTSTNNDHSTPTKKKTKKLGEIVNGEITEMIPEDFAICLGSPSHNERVEKFQEMFHEERVASRLREFMF